MKIEVLDRRKEDQETALSRLSPGDFFFRDESKHPHQVLIHGVSPYLDPSYTMVLVWDSERGNTHTCNLLSDRRVTPIPAVKLVIR